MIHSIRHRDRAAACPATLRVAALVAVLATSTLAHGGPRQQVGNPDPLNAKAAVPPATYASPFATYRPAGELKVLAWPEANDTAARIGGWRAYARESSPTEAMPSTPAGSASRPSTGHVGHGKP